MIQYTVRRDGAFCTPVTVKEGIMRIDKFISDLGVASRRTASAVAARGGVTVNGVAVRDLSRHIDPSADTVSYLGETLVYRRFVYWMLNKPEGYVSATEDRRYPCVTELLPERMRRMDLFPVGRLDKDTVGLMILTNDGALAHRLLSPRHHVEKEYAFRFDSPLPSDAEARFLAGMTIGGEVCKSARLLMEADRRQGRVILTEGKYHQVKRMTEALGARVLYLERLRFADIVLDPALGRGGARPLTENETERLRAAEGLSKDYVKKPSDGCK